MSIRKKTLLIFGITLSCLIILVYLISSRFLLKSYADIEDMEITRNVERVIDSLQFDIDTTESVTYDWATWDDTYAFIADANDNYRTSNLETDTSWISNKLNLMFFVNNSGEVIYSGAFDLIGQVFTSLPQGAENLIAADGPLLSNSESQGISKGIVMLPEGPMIVTAAPILPSDKDGPPRGTLIWGRWLDATIIDNLAEMTHLSLGLQSLDEGAEASTENTEAGSLTEAGQVAIRKPSEGIIAGDTVINDIYGNPALLLSVETPRDVFSQGQRTMYYMIAFLITVGLTIGLVTMFLLEKLVISRMAQLSADVDSIRPDSDFRERVLISGNDEISHLASNINGMMATVQKSKLELQLFNKRLAQKNEALSALYDISSLLSQGTELKPMLEKVLGEITGHDVFNVEHKGGVFLLEGDRLSLIASVGHTEEFLEKHKDMEIGRCLCGRVALSGETIISRDADSDYRHEISYEGMTPHGHVILPLKAADKVEGVLYLYTPVDAGIEIRQLEMLGSISILLGVAIANSRLFEETRRLSLHDSLTGLANRTLMNIVLNNCFAGARRTGRPVSLIMMDLDYFKMYNDTYGHSAGDELLTEITLLLLKVIREADLGVRFGGEEFLVIMPDTTMQEAVKVAERIRSAVDSAQFVPPSVGRPTHISISLGVATFDETVNSEKELIARADAALYLAKESGRNRVECWSPDIPH